MCGIGHKGNRQGNENKGCGSGCQGGRRFASKEEKLNRLNKYKEDLEKEIVEVNEAIQKLNLN